MKIIMGTRCCGKSLHQEILEKLKKENHEQDVFDYQFLGEMFFQIPQKNNNMLIVNKEKKKNE